MTTTDTYNKQPLPDFAHRLELTINSIHTVLPDLEVHGGGHRV